MKMLLEIGDGFGSDRLGKRGSRSGIRKRERPRAPASPASVRARATDISLSVALENHFTPFRK
jgi:hypothetical protein